MSGRRRDPDERCHCGHVEEAHAAIGGQCDVDGCDCDLYDADENAAGDTITSGETP